MKGCDELLGLQDTLKALADPIRREILNLLRSFRMQMLSIEKRLLTQVLIRTSTSTSQH